MSVVTTCQWFADKRASEVGVPYTMKLRLVDGSIYDGICGRQRGVAVPVFVDTAGNLGFHSSPVFVNTGRVLTAEYALLFSDPPADGPWLPALRDVHEWRLQQERIQAEAQARNGHGS